MRIKVKSEPKDISAICELIRKIAGVAPLCQIWKEGELQVSVINSIPEDKLEKVLEMLKNTLIVGSVERV